jgi:hypothetical protein
VDAFLNARRVPFLNSTFYAPCALVTKTEGANAKQARPCERDAPVLVYPDHPEATPRPVTPSPEISAVAMDNSRQAG